jgi:hypothetical protein
MEPILVESVLLYITVRVEKEDAAEECQEFRVDKKIGWAYPEIHRERLMRCHRFIER